MDDHFRDIERYRDGSPENRARYIKELIRVGYLTPDAVLSAAFLGDEASLLIYDDPDFTRSDTQGPSDERAELTQIRHDDRYLRLVTIIDRAPIQQLYKMMIAILRGSDTAITTRAINAAERYLENVNPEEQSPHLSSARWAAREALTELEDRPYEYSFNHQAEQEHANMVAETLRSIFYSAINTVRNDLDAVRNDLDYLRNHAAIDLLTDIDLGGRYARAIGHTSPEIGYEISYEIITDHFIRILLTPQDI